MDQAFIYYAFTYIISNFPQFSVIDMIIPIFFLKRGQGLPIKDEVKIMDQ